MNKTLKNTLRDYHFMLWAFLGMAIALARALFIINSFKECEIDSPADHAAASYIEQGAYDADAATTPPEFVVRSAKFVAMNNFPVLVIGQLSNTNNRGAQSGPLNNVLADAVNRNEEGKQKHNKATENQKFIPLVHDDLANHLDHFVLPTEPVRGV